MLSENGDIHVWFPFRADYTESCTPEAEMDGPACIDGVDGSRMLRWGKVTSSRDVVQTLDKIPIWAESFEIPEWNEAASRFRTEEEAEKVVQIACGRDFIVALKANGEVWLCAANAQRFGSWELVRCQRGTLLMADETLFSTEYHAHLFSIYSHCGILDTDEG